MLTGAGMHSHLKNLRFIQAELTTSSIGQHNKYSFAQKTRFH
ncbi:uncharacterized protein METZ01_LOCUS209065 [marine metagenome]|uniref:Uncharacterized protein n=1 Tax=marine metagenome TaxID=408172 RepID=A0A382F248_9ZZZZ